MASSKDVYQLLWIWGNLRPSEICRIPCAAGMVGTRPPPRKHRRKPELEYAMTRWLDIDLALQELSENEMRRVVIHVTELNSRLPLKLGRKLLRVFRRRGLLS